MERKVAMSTRSQMVQLLTDHPTMTYREIGEMVGCSRQRVHQIARKAGLTRKSRRYREDVTVERVLALYYHSNLFHHDMARILGCTTTIISKRLRMAGISPSAAHSRKMKLRWRVRQAAGVK